MQQIKKDLEVIQFLSVNLTFYGIKRQENKNKKIQQAYTIHLLL